MGDEPAMASGCRTGPACMQPGRPVPQPDAIAGSFPHSGIRIQLLVSKEFLKADKSILLLLRHVNLVKLLTVTSNNALIRFYCISVGGDALQSYQPRSRECEPVVQAVCLECDWLAARRAAERELVVKAVFLACAWLPRVRLAGSAQSRGT